MFPFPRSVAADLRDLFAHDRLAAHARGLGLSSISAGEGSLDLLDAGGNVVASFGDVPGGQGFGLLDGGTVKDIRGLFASDGRVAGVEGRLDTAEDRLNSHASRLGATEGVANGARSEINTARGGFGSLGSRFDSHASRLGATENVANGVRSEVTAAQGGFSTLGARLNDHVGRIGAIEIKLTLAESAIATLQSRQNQIWNYLKAMDPGFPGIPP